MLRLKEQKHSIYIIHKFLSISSLFPQGWVKWKKVQIFGRIYRNSEGNFTDVTDFFCRQQRKLSASYSKVFLSFAGKVFCAVRLPGFSMARNPHLPCYRWKAGGHIPAAIVSGWVKNAGPGIPNRQDNPLRLNGWGTCEVPANRPGECAQEESGIRGHQAGKTICQTGKNALQ